MPLGQVFLGAVPFVLMELLIIGLLVAFPEIFLFLVPWTASDSSRSTPSRENSDPSAFSLKWD